MPRRIGTRGHAGVIWKLDRLGRRFRHLVNTVGELAARGIGLKVLTGEGAMRAYWPSLKDRVDLADLVWLRMIAVGSPNFYRWIEEYLVNFVALASGRAHISEQEREVSARAMDAALALDGLDWDKHRFEIERHLSGIQHHTFNKDRDERLFSRAQRGSHLRDAKDRLRFGGHFGPACNVPIAR